MLKRITKKKSLLLTAAILAAMSVPVQAAEKKQEEATHIKTDEVVVTASRTKQEVRESPSSVEVITREDIDKMGAENLAQALQLALGIDTQENAMVGNRSSIRGMNTNQTLILIDGRRVRIGRRVPQRTGATGPVSTADATRPARPRPELLTSCPRPAHRRGGQPPGRRGLTRWRRPGG